MNAPARLGIMGGTFDPVHFGHLVAAEEALVQFDLDQVLFMPTGVPALKPAHAVSSAEHRYLMSVLATASNDCFDVSRAEIDRPGVTYTVDTLEALHESMPQTELFFITGADAVFEIVQWKDSERVAELATLIAATRPGWDLGEGQTIQDELGPGFRIEYMPVPALAISSTELRARVAHAKPIRYLTPEPVVAYIMKHGLYREAG